MSEQYQPKGLWFFDNATRRHMLLVRGGPWDGWICYKHPDGQWVSLRAATEEDKKQLGILGETVGETSEPEGSPR